MTKLSDQNAIAKQGKGGNGIGNCKPKESSLFGNIYSGIIAAGFVLCSAKHFNIFKPLCFVIRNFFLRNLIVLCSCLDLIARRDLII